MSAVRSLDEWADKYGELKAGGPGRIDAWLGIPLVVGSLIGILWSAPVPEVLRDVSPAINFATLFLMATFVYYSILSISLGFGGFLFLLIAAAPSVYLANADLPLAQIAPPVFFVALIWQVAETKRATGRMLVVRNLQYLMLGPIWMLRAAFRRLGLPY